MTQVCEKISNSETKQDTLLKLGIQLLYTCSYFLKTKNKNLFFWKKWAKVFFKVWEQLQDKHSKLMQTLTHKKL